MRRFRLALIGLAATAARTVVAGHDAGVEADGGDAGAVLGLAAARRWSSALTEQVRKMVWAAIRRTFPHADEAELRVKYAEHVYGADVAAQEVTTRVARALEQLNIGYYLAGSFASGVHGVFRAPDDTDLVADLPPYEVEKLAAALGADFDADVEMMKEAVQLRRSFNVVHLASLWKVDVFVLKDRPYDAEALARAQDLQLDPSDTRTVVKIATPEDTVLAKLERYRKGNEVSDRRTSRPTCARAR